jgi:hypothetical protein
MPGRIENFDEKTFGKIEENLTIRQAALKQVITIKGYYITFLFKGHYPEIVERKHIVFFGNP